MVDTSRLSLLIANLGIIRDRQKASGTVDIEVEKALKLANEVLESGLQDWRKLPPEDQRKEDLDDFFNRYLAHGERAKDVTEFISTHTIGNEDGFYTPSENKYETREATQREFHSRSWGDYDEGIKHGPDGDDTSEAPQPRHPEYGCHPSMDSWLELPYGRICDNCGGSMVAIIQLSERGEVLRTTLADCG